MSATGMGAAPATPVRSTGLPEITHIEIRRVQNGFVIAGINMDVFQNSMGGTMPQRATFIAKDIAELANLLEWIDKGSQMKWLPTVDLPVWDMEHRVAMMKNNQASAP